MQGHQKMIWKRCLHSCPEEKKIWTKLGRRKSLTDIACFHRAVQVELLLFHEEILKGQKEADTTAALCEPSLCPVPPPATALSFATAGERQRGQAASSDCWQTSHTEMWDTQRNLSKPPGRIERGSHCPVPAKEISPKQLFHKWGLGKNELLQLGRAQGEGSGSLGIFHLDN